MFLLAPKGPYVCVNCGFWNNSSVFKMYGNSVIQHHSRSPSTAGTSRSLLSSAQNKSGMTHRLTECEKCKKPVDEYVQLDNSILFLDSILQKQSFYRHILLNCQISNKNATKMAVIFGLCEAFQRWTTLNGAVSASDQKNIQSPNLISSKSYFHLEVSFYLIFVCVIIENALFNLIFFCIFQIFSFASVKYFGQSRGPSPVRAVSFFDLFLSVIICSYGKLFIIPSYLYAGELKHIVDQLNRLFCLFSLVQCALVKGHLFLKRYQSVALVALTLLLHHFSFNVLLIPLFRFFSSLIPIDDNLLGDYLA